MHRRRFLQSIAAAAATPVIAPACAAPARDLGPLRSDPANLLDLPEGFSYRIVSRHGAPMDDGLRCPGAHDGMSAFPRPDGRIAIVCNHETLAGWPEEGPFGDDYARVPAAIRERIYDRGGDSTPALGGTTTTIWNPQSNEVERQFMSLGGTEVNCAGGPTPWGSWLTCEEIFSSPGPGTQNGNAIHRDQRHGYVFEVPAAADSIIDPVPLKEMGRFVHEAAAVDPATGIVYLTEDKGDGLIYRYIPKEAGKLSEGGRLQALAIIGRPALPTGNWDERLVSLNDPLPCNWIDIEDPDPEENTVRYEGAAKGAALFARSEGMCWAGDRVAFACTEGGADHVGQVFTYRPNSADGGELELIAEVGEGSIMRRCDNIIMAPWGDLICCEDRGLGSGMVGIRPDGSLYRFALNAYTKSELAGACFSPDGRTMFVNIQYPGMTLAITGPWPN